MSDSRVNVDAADAFDLLPTPTAIVGLDGEFQRVNPAFCRFLRCSAEDLLARHVQSISDPNDIDGKDSRFVLPGGREIWAEVITVPITDQGGAAHRLLIQVHDVDERKRTELRLRAENDELQSVATRSSDVLAASTHEMRSPLTTIAGLAQTLEQRWPDLTDEARGELLTALRRQSERLAGLAGDLLTLASADAGAPVVDARSVVAAPLVAQAVASAGFKEDEVTVDCPPGLLISADPSRLTQILVNLLSNARRHGEPPISVRVAAEGDAVELCVADQGPGVPAEFAGRLFDRFSRATDAARHDPKGSGLGLAIVRELTEAHGGDVWYEPNSPRGARFCVRLRRRTERP